MELAALRPWPAIRFSLSFLLFPSLLKLSTTELTGIQLPSAVATLPSEMLCAGKDETLSCTIYCTEGEGPLADGCSA